MKNIVATLNALITPLILLANAHAQFDIRLTAETGKQQSRFEVFSGYMFQPNIDVLVGDTFTDALVTFESPNARFSAVQDPDNPSTIGSSARLDSTNKIVEEVNGTWRVTIDEGINTYEYEVDIEFTLPFTNLPSIASSTLVSGNPVGEFQWTLEGGSAEFPGDASEFLVSLRTGSFDSVDSDRLPFDAKSWTPEGDFSVSEEFIGDISTFLEAQDFDSLQVLEVRSLSDGAPDLIFSSVAVEYIASLSANLVSPIVPEPSSVVLACTAVFLICLRR